MHHFDKATLKRDILVQNGISASEVVTNNVKSYFDAGGTTFVFYSNGRSETLVSAVKEEVKQETPQPIQLPPVAKKTRKRKDQ